MQIVVVCAVVGTPCNVNVKLCYFLSPAHVLSCPPVKIHRGWLSEHSGCTICHRPSEDAEGRWTLAGAAAVTGCGCPSKIQGLDWKIVNTKIRNRRHYVRTLRLYWICSAQLAHYRHPSRSLLQDKRKRTSQLPSLQARRRL